MGPCQKEKVPEREERECSGVGAAVIPVPMKLGLAWVTKPDSE